MAHASRQERRIRRIKLDRNRALKMLEVALYQRDLFQQIAIDQRVQELKAQAEAGASVPKSKSYELLTSQLEEVEGLDPETVVPTGPEAIVPEGPQSE